MEEQKQAEQQWNKIRRERINILKEAPSEDRVLYVVRHDMAEIPQIEKGMESFIQEDKLLGYLINRSQKGFASYGKYGYGKYGYGKYGYGKYGKYQRYVDVKEDDMDTEDSL